MDSRAEVQATSGSSAGPNASGLLPGPLGQLETELEATIHERPDGKLLYEKAQILLDEAWTIFTECRVMREGLLDACEEIERTMESIQQGFASAPAVIQTSGREHAADGTEAAGPAGASVH
jgi:hypothetical protein